MKISFNKEQKEGLAKFLDSLSAAAVIGGIIGSTGHNTISTAETLMLFLVAAVMLCLSLYLRKSIDPQENAVS